MPNKLQRKQAREVGKKGDGTYVWVACADCGKERWVQNNRSYRRCPSCAHRALRDPNRRYTNSLGYVICWSSPDNPYRSMAKENGEILEHRLVMAEHLGRCLSSTEIVHHINHVRNDNRVENLTVMTPREHMQGFYHELLREIETLKRQIEELEWQLQLKEI